MLRNLKFLLVKIIHLKITLFTLRTKLRTQIERFTETITCSLLIRYEERRIKIKEDYEISVQTNNWPEKRTSYELNMTS